MVPAARHSPSRYSRLGQAAWPVHWLASVPSHCLSCYRDSMKPLALALLLAGFAMPAGDPPGFFLWKSAELKGFSKTLAPKLNDKKVATQTVAAFGNYSFMVAHREGSGEAEYHATQTD